MRNSATIELVGYVYGQPEKPIADRFPNFISFSLSVTRKWKDKDGNDQKELTRYRCQSWSEGLSKMIRNNIKGGMGLIVRGIPKCNAYIDKDGMAKAQIEVRIQDLNMLTFLKDEKDEVVATSAVPVSEANIEADNGRFKIAPRSIIPEVIDIPDDEIPF